MNVLLSVKPKYAEEILSGRKKYEFRRSIFKKQDIEKVYIYSSSPVSKIVAAFEIGEVLKGSPENIWNLCHKYAGISKKDFFAYFKNSDVAYAIKIGNIDSFLNPIDPFHIIEDFKPPQSFYYVPLSFLLNRWDDQYAQLQKCTHLNEHFSGISLINNCKFED